MNSKSLRRSAKAAAVVASATVAFGLLSTGAAHADTFVPLQDGEITQALIDGTVVTVRQTGNTALISPSMGSTPLHRNVWASGSIDVSISGNAEGATIDAGYIVACQLSFGSKVSSEGEVGPFNRGTLAGNDVDFGATAKGGITIGPGEAKSVPILQIKDGDDTKSSFDFEGNSGGFTYADETFGVSGCAGYAQARSYVKVKVSTDAVDGTVTLWGQPFSLG